MKKIISITLAISLMCLVFTGCGYSKVESKADPKNPSMFVTVEDGGSWNVVYHRDTKVMYAISASSYNYGNFALLVNPDGSPMLWEGE